MSRTPHCIDWASSGLPVIQPESGSMSVSEAIWLQLNPAIHHRNAIRCAGLPPDPRMQRDAQEYSWPEAPKHPELRPLLPGLGNPMHGFRTTAHAIVWLLPRSKPLQLRFQWWRANRLLAKTSGGQTSVEHQAPCGYRFPLSVDSPSRQSPLIAPPLRATVPWGKASHEPS